MESCVSVKHNCTLQTKTSFVRMFFCKIKLEKNSSFLEQTIFETKSVAPITKSLQKMNRMITINTALLKQRPYGFIATGSGNLNPFLQRQFVWSLSFLLSSMYTSYGKNSTLREMTSPLSRVSCSTLLFKIPLISIRYLSFLINND